MINFDSITKEKLQDFTSIAKQKLRKVVLMGTLAAIAITASGCNMLSDNVGTMKAQNWDSIKTEMVSKVRSDHQSYFLKVDKDGDVKLVSQEDYGDNYRDYSYFTTHDGVKVIASPEQIKTVESDINNMFDRFKKQDEKAIQENLKEAKEMRSEALKNDSMILVERGGDIRFVQTPDKSKIGEVVFEDQSRQAEWENLKDKYKSNQEVNQSEEQQVVAHSSGGGNNMLLNYLIWSHMMNNNTATARMYGYQSSNYSRMSANRTSSMAARNFSIRNHVSKNSSKMFSSSSSMKKSSKFSSASKSSSFKSSKSCSS